MLHNATQCYALIRNAMQLSNAMVVQPEAFVCNAMQCYAMLSNAAQCYAMLSNAAQCYAMLRIDTQCNAAK